MTTSPRPSGRHRSRARRAVLVVAALLTLLSGHALAQLALDENASIAAMVAELSGPGVDSLTNLTITFGQGRQYGLFSGGNIASGAGPVMGIPDGLFLTTGAANDSWNGNTTTVGPNSTGRVSYQNGTTYSDPDLTAIDSGATRDVVVIEFDVVPQFDYLKVLYVFGSDEYPEYVCTIFNDVFGFFVEGTFPDTGNTETRNIALVPGTSGEIAVNTVNNGSAGSAQSGGNSAPCDLGNSAFYVDNGDGSTPSANQNLQFDGFTVPLVAATRVTPGQSYHVKLAIADAGDAQWDSAMFLNWVGSSEYLANADLSLDKTISTSVPTVGDAVTFTLTVANDGPDAVPGVEVTDLLPSGYTYLSDDSGGVAGVTVADYDPVTGVWTLPATLASGASASLQITALVDASGDYTNSAEITAAQATDPDSQPGNAATAPSEDDTANVTPTVQAGYDVAGTVYHDLTPNARRDGSDGATGLTLWVKRVAEADGDCSTIDDGPADEAASVAGGDGSYLFSGVLDGSWCLLLDDNASLADVTPFDAGAAGWLYIEPPAGVRSLTVAGVAVDEQDFGLFAGSRVTGTVFRDDGRLAAGGPAASSVADATDGRRSATEQGVAGVTVTASDGAQSRSVATDGDGAYALYLPAAWGAPVTLSHPLRPASGVDDGVSPQLATGWDGADAAAVAFTPTAGGAASYDFGVVRASRLRPDGNGQARSPGATDYAHLYTPGTLGSVTLAVAGGRWSYQLYLDSDCDGTVSAAERSDVLTSGFTVGAAWPRTADGALAGCALELRVLVPAGEPDGRLDLALLTAELAWQGNAAVRDARAVTDATTVASGAVEAGKRVRNVSAGGAFGTVGAGEPGEELEYCIDYRNLGTDPVTDAEVLDPLPHFAALVVGSAVPAAQYSADDGASYGYTPVADGAGLDGAVDGLRWLLGSVAAGASGEVCYWVVIE